MPLHSVNGVPRLDGSSDKIEAEDGEIEDAKMSDAPMSNNTASKAGQLPEKAVTGTPKAEHQSAPLPAVSDASKFQRKESPTPIPTTHHTSLTPPPPEIKPLPPSSSTPTVRPDLSRAASTEFASGRPTHNLPSKPEPSQIRPGDYRMPPRIGERFPQDHARESRHPERGEPRDMPRDRALDRFPSGSHAHSTERLQGMERDRVDQRWNNDRAMTGRSGADERLSGSQNRDSRYPARDDRPSENRHHAEQHSSYRNADGIEHQSRDTAMPPPKPNVSQHPINPERAALIHGSQAPDRGQLMGVHPDRRNDPSRYDNQARHERTSRGPSPARAEDRQPPRYDSRREDPTIHGRRPMDDISRTNPPRFEESNAPTGPRTNRPASTGPGPSNGNDRFRDSIRAPTHAPPVDPNHGRLSHESNFPNRQPESQYGRLNSDNEIPSGPRMPNGNHPAPARGGRNVSAPQPQLNTQLPPQNHGPPTPIHDRQTPSGPSMRGSPRKPPPFSQPPVNSSAPPTPVAQSPDTASIHPDRLKALQGSGAVNVENTPPNQRGPRQGPPPLSMPPRGPNNNQLPSPVGPSAHNRGPPTGPAIPNDRMGRDKRTLAGLQNTLQQASAPSVPERSGQGASIRGRGGRANNVNGPSPGSSAPPTPNLSRPDQLPPREDLFAGRPNGAGAPYQPEDDSSYARGGRRGGPRDGPGDGDRRSGRHRSHSPGKDILAGVPPRMREDEMMQGRDGMRDRPRGNNAPPERGNLGASGPLEANIRGSGGPPDRDLRDRGPPRDTRRPGRDDGQFRDRRGEPDMRGDDRDRRDGGRKRGRGGDEGQGERNFSDSKRPRR